MSSARELSPIQEHKKRLRPSPITIPLQPPPRMAVPGPNAFAIAEHTQQEEADRQCGKRSATQTPVTSPLEDSQFLRTESHASKASKDKDKDKHRASGVANHFTQLMDQARSKSPRKSDGHSSSTTSYHGSTTRSRHSERSHRSTKSSHNLNDNEMTSRASIEGRAEKKFFKMMGQVPSTPTTESADGYTSVIVQTHDLSSKGIRKTAEEAKSPKKKMFGMSLPGFMSSVTSLPSSTIEPVPPMPSKAARLLGTSPVSKRYPRSSPHSFRTPRSDTSKSLPFKIYDHPSHSRRHYHGGSARTRPRASSRKTQSPVKDVHRQRLNGDGSLDLGVPPTPPQKDTPPDSKEKIEEAMHPAYQGTLQKEELEARDLFVDGGVPVQLPLFVAAANPIPCTGGESPMKFRPFGAEDYAKLIEGSRVESTHAHLDFEEGNVNDRLEELQPTFYSPSTSSPRLSKNTDPNHFLFTCPQSANTASNFSRDNCSHGDRSEIDTNSVISKTMHAAAQETASPGKNDQLSPATGAVHQLHAGHDQEASVRARESSYLHPEPSSSRLTDILSGITLSKSDFSHDSFPHFPSAVPSPLHSMPGQQQMPHPMIMGPPPGPMDPPHSLNWAQHFHMTNEHIDVSGRTLYDFVAECNHNQLVASKSRHGGTVVLLEKYFQEIKVHITSIETEIGRATEQTHSVDAKLDKLLDFIKTDIVEPLATQTKRSTDMEDSIKAMQKSMSELEKSMGAKMNLAPGPVSSSQFLLPTHHSQPSLAGFRDPLHEPGRENSSQLPSNYEARNNGRFRYGTTNGQNWQRPMTRENNKETPHPFSAMNPYINGAASYGGGGGGGGDGGGNGYMGGYLGYPYPNTLEQNYSYSHGAPK